jgi:hypothetical protein
MAQWTIAAEVFAHSTGKGADVDRAAAGPRNPAIRVRAESIEDAIRLAECFLAGISLNPAVWQAQITSVHREPEHEKKPFGVVGRG